MTTPNKPSPQANNNPATISTKPAWYSVPVLWVGLFLTLLLVAGLVHLAVLGHKHASDALTAKPQSKELTHILGMPLSEPAAKPAEPTK